MWVKFTPTEAMPHWRGGVRVGGKLGARLLSKADVYELADYKVTELLEKFPENFSKASKPKGVTSSVEPTSDTSLAPPDTVKDGKE